jgi:hypothetical protein
MSEIKEETQVTLTKQLVVSIIELIDFYTKKGVFKIKEYKDIYVINERLSEIVIDMEADKPIKELTSQEYAFIILILKEGTGRTPTLIDNFGQLFTIYQHYQTLLEQKLESEKDLEKKKESIPRVEELSIKE